ncbi:NADPH-dependent F420 reductase [Bifidobacterium sp.]|jgi:predicted dinucleotide-binding enzyme|uniref:NADPH-dependent F420 reductase n=1 Tax=Bifidobacterium sp. TaxID=41200 RepID=UPI0025B9D54A|nr:NADPH-dependent F420 reductase [Bifidobacterium sp.]MCI1634956.1 NADPH-dependent F420 reductase [Bifidobacterium sp.]
MSKVTIFGKGNMGSALSGIAEKAGAEVQAIDSSTAEGTAISGEIVILAVPYPALEAIVNQYGEQLPGKTVVDITNPLDFSTFDSLVTPSDSSAAQQLAEKLPEAHVLKAFNTNFAATLASGKIGEKQTTVLIAGDDADAKTDLSALVQAAGLEAIDAGALKRARELEAIGFLQLTLAAGEKIAWTGGFAVQR